MSPHPLRAMEPGDLSPGLLRTPPHNVEVERALLGAILLNNRAYEKVQEFLAPDHFTEAVNGRIYAALGKLIDQGHQASAVTLKTYLERDDLVIAAGGMKYLASLSSNMVTVINAADYGKLIYDLHLRRELIALGEDMVNSAFDAQIDETAHALIDEAATRLDALCTPAQSKHMSMADAVSSTLTEWETADKDDGSGLSTGMVALDTAAGKLKGGDSVYIAGNTSMGKTALATAIMKNAGAQGKRVGYFTLEMPVQQLTGRLITAETGIPGPRQRRWSLNSDQWGKVVHATTALSDIPLIMRHIPGLSLSGLRSMCRQIKRKGGLDLVIVDYLQIMRTESHRFENRTQEISRLTMGLKTLAGELDVPLICLSQLSRENWRRENPRPILPDLRDSGSIEQDADAIWFCYREEYFLERTRPERKENETSERFMDRVRDHETRLEACRGIGEVIVAKNRHGPVGTARLRFDAPRAWFEDLPGVRQQQGLGFE